jgi:UDP-N-acetylglucosamine 2-epimerase (non-hydrolysing)
MLKVINIVGARPNFMKMAPIIRMMNQHPTKIRHLLVHTGQHYDQKMSKAFFDDLGMPKPDIDLGVGSGSHAEQTAKIMIEFEKVCLREKPDLVVVVGDVNSTMACTITAKKMLIKVAHVEAGLRSRDMTMPEEVNRLCTDVLCDFLFTTDHFANENLLTEGVPKEKIHFVGNVMIDTLLSHMVQARKMRTYDKLGLTPGKYAVTTIHRPSNVDDPLVFTGILEALQQIAKDVPLVFPMHPRTKKMLQIFHLDDFVLPIEQANGRLGCGVWGIEPLGYLDFLNLNMNARFVLTDSGGLQEETTVLGIPCVTIRNNTERPITCEVGTNSVVGNKSTSILEAVRKIQSGDWQKGGVPEKWDGNAAERIIQVILRSFNI